MTATFTISDLSSDQKEAYDTVFDWAHNSYGKPLLTLGGLAGSGKTTVTGVLAKELGLSPVAFIAFTGRASSVLRRKLREAGVETVSFTATREGGTPPDSLPYCGTIHSFIYAPIEYFRCPLCKESQGRQGTCDRLLDKVTNRKCAGVLEETGEIGGWARREILDRQYKCIVTDESSMISDDMLDDLKLFGVPILAVGDHGQLQPVNGMGSLMADPDIKLEKIHRQAEGNPIIKLAHAVRTTGRIDTKLADGDRVIIDRLSALPKYIDQWYKNANTEDIFNKAMICYSNERRVTLNIMARTALGFENKPPARKGDIVICLRNQRDVGVYNGMRAIMRSEVDRDAYYPWVHSADLDFIEDDIAGKFPMCAVQFNRKYTFKDYWELRERKIFVDNWNEAGGLFDFGYALTAHKSQGATFKEALVVCDGPGRMGFNEYKRWLYTSFTRPSDRLIVLM